MKNLILILAVLFCTNLYADERPTQYSYVEPPTIPYYQPYWSNPRSYYEVIDLVERTRNFAIIVWSGPNCPWCVKYKNETLQYYQHFLNKNYIYYESDVVRERAAFDRLRMLNRTLYNGNTANKWMGEVVIPITMMFGPDKNGNAVIYGVRRGSMSITDFGKWHNEVLDYWGVKRPNPSPYQSPSPAPRPYQGLRY